ncbi:MAG: hypothetical protein ABJN40_09620 [Sneathiella sp.]
MHSNGLKLSLLAILILVIAACQPLERPFQPSQKTGARTAPGPRASLYVAPVVNGPEELSQALAKKLQDLGIAAFSGEKLENRYQVASQIIIQKQASYVVWTILDPSGQETQLSTMQKIGDIAAGPVHDDDALEKVALRSASEIDIMLGGTGANFSTMAKPRIFVPIVATAPGDGSETLSAAMQNQILQYGMDVLPDEWQASYLVKGTVELTKPQGGTQIVSIVWKLERRNGEYVGKVEQKNRIRAGTLNGPWGPVAVAAAKGGARGIMKLLRQAEPAYFRSKS